MKLEQYLKQVKKRCEAASDGPWKCNQFGPKYPAVWKRNGDILCSRDRNAGSNGNASRLNAKEAEFIAHARADVPMLLEMVECLRQQVSGPLINETNEKLESLVPGGNNE